MAREWVLGLELPQDIADAPGLMVQQDGFDLEQDEREEDCWRLIRPLGSVLVRHYEEEGIKEVEIDLGQGECLLFKLSCNLDRGRRVKAPSSGSYLVIAPDSWQLDDSLSDPPPVSPAYVHIAGLRAHFVYFGRDGNSRVVFRSPEGKYKVESVTPRFRLAGTCIDDARRDVGHLYVHAPPTVHAIDSSIWGSVGAIVLGEEGRGRRKWRTRFVPDVGEKDLALQSELANRGVGWYFLRFYDTEDSLIESLDFRLAAGLQSVDIPPYPPWPDQRGHEAVCVTFRHDAGWVVKPDCDNAGLMRVESGACVTIAQVPPQACYDRTHWLVGPKEGHWVQVDVLIERLWWAIGEENVCPRDADWTDRCSSSLPRSFFTATSSKAIWFRIPDPGWVQQVSLGIGQTQLRPYPLKAGEQTVCCPLRELSDIESVRTGSKCLAVVAQIERDGRKEQCVVAHLEPLTAAFGEKIARAGGSAFKQWIGIGRKNSVLAQAKLCRGSGGFLIDGKPLEEYLEHSPLKGRDFLDRLLRIDQVKAVLVTMDVEIIVAGGRPISNRQPKAVAHALARGLASYNPALRSLLRWSGFGGARVKDRDYGW